MSLDGHSPCEFTVSDKSVPEKNELGDGGKGSKEGTLGRDPPQAGGGNTDGRAGLVVGHADGADPSNHVVISFAD